MKSAPKKKILSLPHKKEEAIAPAKPSEEIEVLSPYISEVSGAQGLRIVKSIGDGATDEIIEKNTGFKIAEIRSILNHLHSYGIVEYTREKNMTTGWFTYTWKVNANRALHNFLSNKQKEYTATKAQLTGAENVLIYACKSNCGRHNFDVAMENKFRCPSCNGALKEMDRVAELGKLELKILALNKIREMSSSGKKIVTGSPSSGVAAAQGLLKKISAPKNHAANLARVRGIGSKPF